MNERSREWETKNKQKKYTKYTKNGNEKRVKNIPCTREKAKDKKYKAEHP